MHQGEEEVSSALVSIGAALMLEGIPDGPWEVGYIFLGGIMELSFKNVSSSLKKQLTSTQECTFLTAVVDLMLMSYSRQQVKPTSH